MNTLREEWLEASKYPGDHRFKLGCCGGDYCEVGRSKKEHNDYIADWWIEKMNAELEEIAKEIDKSTPYTENAHFANALLKDGYLIGLNDAIAIIRSHIKGNNK